MDPARVARYAEAIRPAKIGRYLSESTMDEFWPVVTRAVMAVADAELAELRAEVEQLRGPFRCCPHCPEDVVHDVEPDAHDLPCQICEDTLRVRAEAAEAKVAAVEALADEWEVESGERDEQGRAAFNRGDQNASIVLATLAAAHRDGSTRLRAALSVPAADADGGE